ncbi:type I restriction-modification system methyltransferase subunit [Streptococcus pneumoniae]|nr:type I restriction-modification system methyltransferase subunit [Streptococcus pneumoniae]VOJ12940.1 type I restriction-modification system methyltransferase subunit [Streptococcus pneumoniae]VSW66186.1 type I restriction-modification system methyltransferase subunit [Streptococcus pneumoniae]
MAEYQPKYSCIRDFFKVSSSSRDFWIANYDLSINKYKEIEYEKVEYEPTEVILKKINDLEKEIQAGLAELEKLLK